MPAQRPRSYAMVHLGTEAVPPTHHDYMAILQQAPWLPLQVGIYVPLSVQHSMLCQYGSI